jgi:hypothetical protein
VKSKVLVFAVLHLDLDRASVEDAVSVKEVLPNEEDASAEVERLHALNGDKGTRYFWLSNSILS